MITATCLGYCIGSDRYHAYPDSGGWKVVDVHGETVIHAKVDEAVSDPMEAIHTLRAATVAVRPHRFDVGNPPDMNLDLLDPFRKAWDDPTRTPADRVVIWTVRPTKDSFEVELSDGSHVPWSILGEVLSEIRPKAAHPQVSLGSNAPN